MKIIISSILAVSILLSCQSSTSTTKDSETDKSQIVVNDSTEQIAVRHLFNKIRKASNVSFKDNEILIGDTSIRLKLNVEFDGQKESNWVYAANIRTTYKANKETQINVGAIGIGSTKEEAVDICIQEWFAVFGIPFTTMLNNDKSITVSNMKVSSGLMGVRGNLPENTWLKGDDDMTQKIISQLQQQIKTKTGDIIPIDIKLMIGKGGVFDGECRIDNEVSIELLNNLKQLDWPSSDEAFMFKQFYLVKKTDK